MDSCLLQSARIKVDYVGWAQGIPHDKLSGHKGTVTSLAFRRDGMVLASGSEANEVFLWDLVNRTRTNLKWRHLDEMSHC